MHLPPFLLDQWLATHELASPPIRYNLAASTGPRWTVGELLALGGQEVRETLEELSISYAPANGALALRERIGELHGVDPDWVVVTTGASEALLALFCLAAEPGANVVLPFPVFPAMPVVARAWGLEVRSYTLSREDRFAHDAARVLAAVDARTRLVLVNTPHNPTGAVMPADEMVRLVDALADRGIPVAVDEVYHPLYFGVPTPTAARLPNTLAVSDISKALSLSGLRIGWVIARDARTRERLVNLRSYFTISSSPVTEAIAASALAAAPVILARLQTVTRANLAALTEFMSGHRDVVDWIPPAGGTIAFPWLVSGGDTRPLAEALAREGVLIVPGDCFDAPSHFRVGFGVQVTGFADALARVSQVLSVTAV
jgi:aspartate/methionine/tyrosine aminotransferase